jgi:Flp pilus assembly protein TadD
LPCCKRRKGCCCGRRTLNPLNTDHTANLARLNTRWSQLAADSAVQAERVNEAEFFYQKAISLSPQNSIIRNEYAGLFMS